MEHVYVKPTPQTRHKDAEGKPLPRVFRSPVYPHRPIPEYGAHLPMTPEVYRALRSKPPELVETDAKAVEAGRKAALEKAERITKPKAAEKPADQAKTKGGTDR